MNEMKHMECIKFKNLKRIETGKSWSLKIKKVQHPVNYYEIIMKLDYRL